MPLTGTQWAASIEPLGVLNAAMVAGHASQLISDLTAAAQVATVAGRVVGNAFLLAMVEAEHIGHGPQHADRARVSGVRARAHHMKMSPRGAESRGASRRRPKTDEEP